MAKIAIIGAGLSGLTAARFLLRHADVTVFDKSRGVGGRMATRYTDRHVFDHGAQYFTARTLDFKRFLAPFDEAGGIAHWPDRLMRFKAPGMDPLLEPSDQRLVAVPRMTSLAKEMAEGLDLKRGVRIERLSKGGDGWSLIDDKAVAHGPFDWVISTAPAPQTFALMPDGFNGRDALSKVRMAGCFTLMLGFDHLPLPDWDAAFADGNPVGWMSFSHIMPGRQSAPALVIQSGNAWAEQHLEDPRDAVMDHLLKAAQTLTGIDLGGHCHADLHRWRYANVTDPLGEPFMLDTETRLAACGDWCLGGRVEAAFESGHQLAEVLLAELGF